MTITFDSICTNSVNNGDHALITGNLFDNCNKEKLELFVTAIQNSNIPLGSDEVQVLHV